MMNYQNIYMRERTKKYMRERAKKVDYITRCLNKEIPLSALIINRTISKYSTLRGKIVGIHFEYTRDKVYPDIYVTAIDVEDIMGRKLNAVIDSFSIDDIIAFYPKDEMKVEEKTMTDKEKFTPKRINFRSKKGCYYTDVLWSDGTVTVVKLKENEDFDEYTAFCAALAKKIFGSSNSVNTIVKKKACYPPNKKKQKNSIERKEDMPMAKEFMSELDKAFENLHKYK